VLIVNQLSVENGITLCRKRNFPRETEYNLMHGAFGNCRLLSVGRVIVTRFRKLRLSNQEQMVGWQVSHRKLDTFRILRFTGVCRKNYSRICTHYVALLLKKNSDI